MVARQSMVFWPGAAGTGSRNDAALYWKQSIRGVCYVRSCRRRLDCFHLIASLTSLRFRLRDSMPETPTSLNLADYIRDVNDFPKPGIVFKDITPLLSDHAAFEACIDRFEEEFKDKNIDVVAAAEARGFLFAAPLALRLGVGMVPIRKPGKLPFDKHSYSYELEYGTDTLEMHIDGIESGQNVLVIDDLLATGGTVQACCEMIEACNANIAACAFLIRLKFLDGASKLANHKLFSLIDYE